MRTFADMKAAVDEEGDLFGLDVEDAAIWHQEKASAYQYALEMLPLHNSN